MITNIRYIRKKRGLTLNELADLTGFTTAYISLIERNMRNPSINTLFKIAKALNVRTESLWTLTNTNTGIVDDEKYIVVRKSFRDPAKRLNPGAEYQSITINRFLENRSIGLIGHIGTLSPGSSTNPGMPAVHNEDELTYILCGSMHCEFEDSVLDIEEGDAFIVKAGTLHNFVNCGKEPVNFLTVRYVD